MTDWGGLVFMLDPKTKAYIKRKSMQFEWNEIKNATNIKKHKIDFADVPIVFKGATLIDYDDRYDHGEDRWTGIGLLHNLVVVVVFTEPRKNIIRIISARKANRNEQEKYYEKAI